MGRTFGQYMQHLGSEYHASSYLSCMSCRFGVLLGVVHAYWLPRRCERASPGASTDRSYRGKTEAETARCLASGPGAGDGGADYAGRAACDQEQQLRSGAQNLYTTVGTTSDTISHDTIDALPQGTNATIEGAVAGSGRLAGLCGQRQSMSAAITPTSSTASTASCFPMELPVSASVLETGLIGEHLPARRRAAGRVRLAHRGPRRHDDARRGHFQQLRQYQLCTAAAGEPFSRASSTAARSAATARRQHRPQGNRAQLQRTVFPACNISSAAAICRPPRASKIRCRRSMLSTISRSKKEVSATCRPSSTRRRGLSLITGTSYSTFQIPNVPGGAALFPAFPAGHVQFNHAQRKPDRVHPIWRAGAATFNSRASMGNCPISPVTTICISPRIRSAICCSTASPRTSAAEPTRTVSRATGSYLVNPANTAARSDSPSAASRAWVDNSSLVEPCMACDGSDNGSPETITDVSKARMAGRRLCPGRMENHRPVHHQRRAGFDQMDEFINANQLSPRLSFTYKPFEDTALQPAMRATSRRR